MLRILRVTLFSFVDATLSWEKLLSEFFWELFFLFWEPFLGFGELLPLFWELISRLFWELIGVPLASISYTTFFSALLPQPFRQQKPVGTIGEGRGEEG